MIKIYHNTRCKKSRAGLEYLKSKDVDFTIIQYLKDQPFTFESLKKLLKKMKVKPQDMIRKQEKIYKELFKGKNFSDDEQIKIMVENPKLINRPIIETDDNAEWGDPPSEIDKLF